MLVYFFAFIVVTLYYRLFVKNRETNIYRLWIDFAVFQKRLVR